MATNSEVELEIARCLSGILRNLRLLPEGYQCDVQLHRGSRKKRRDADFDGNWDPDIDSIRIGCSQVEEEEIPPDKVAALSGTAKAESVEGRLADLLRALDRAEGRPGYEFVSLKWFRDTALAHEGFAWATDEVARHDALREAIDRRWILTTKVANPRPPNFPVTAIRLNRQMPEVIAALGGRPTGNPVFHPVPIRGESLSATILRDRR
jgi:hypothetical protein